MWLYGGERNGGDRGKGLVHEFNVFEQSVLGERTQHGIEGYGDIGRK
jgi:hypothetical protein